MSDTASSHPIRKNRKKWKKLLAIYYLYCYTQLKHKIPISQVGNERSDTVKFNTSLLHGAFRGEPQTGATLTPIYQSSAFEQESAERLEKIFHNQAPGFSYTRINNPTVEAFEKWMPV